MDSHDFLTVCHFLNYADTSVIDGQCRWAGMHSKCISPVYTDILCFARKRVPLALLFSNATTP